MAVLAQVLFDERVLEQVVQHKALLRKVATTEKAYRGLLGGLERLVGMTHPKVMPKIPHILKVEAPSTGASVRLRTTHRSAVPMDTSVCVMVCQACYDNDILPEEAILAWGKKPSKKYLDKDTAAAVRKLAQPVLAWLEYGTAPSSCRL